MRVSNISKLFGGILIALLPISCEKESYSWQEWKLIEMDVEGIELSLDKPFDLYGEAPASGIEFTVEGTADETFNSIFNVGYVTVSGVSSEGEEKNVTYFSAFPEYDHMYEWGQLKYLSHEKVPTKICIYLSPNDTGVERTYEINLEGAYIVAHLKIRQPAMKK